MGRTATSPGLLAGLVLLILTAGGWYAWKVTRVPAAVPGDSPALAYDLRLARWRGEFTAASEDALGRDLAAADAFPAGSEKHFTLREAAEAAHRQRLNAVPRFAKIFADRETDRSPELDEFFLVLDRDGPVAALAHAQTRRADLLQNVPVTVDDARRRLLPLLRAAQLALIFGRTDDAESLFRDLLRAAPADWTNLREQHWVFLLHYKLPRAQSHGLRREVSAICEKAEKIARRFSEQDPASPGALYRLAATLSASGEADQALGGHATAVRSYTASREMLERLVGNESPDPAWQSALVRVHGRLGKLAEAGGDLDEASRCYRRALELCEKLAAADPADTDWQEWLAIIQVRLGDLARSRAKLGEAGLRYTTALRIYEKLAAAAPEDPKWQRGLYGIRSRQAALADDAGRGAETLGHWRETRRILEGLQGRDILLSPAESEHLKIIQDWLDHHQAGPPPPAGGRGAAPEIPRPEPRVPPGE